MSGDSWQGLAFLGNEIVLQFNKASGTAFFAGGLSLVSQIVGLRIITREVSASELTVASVLVCALGGLSIGALISGRIVDQRKNPETSALRLANFLLAGAAVVSLLFALLGQTLAGRIADLKLSEILEVVSFLSATVLPVNILLGGIVPVLTQAAMARSANNVRSAFGLDLRLGNAGSGNRIVGRRVLSRAVAGNPWITDRRGGDRAGVGHLWNATFDLATGIQDSRQRDIGH